MSSVHNTDWLVVSRGGKPYKCSVADFLVDMFPPADAPEIASFSISDVAGGSRFTGVNFPLHLTMTEDGNPASTKQLKAWVTGTHTWTPVTDKITAVNSVAGPVYSSWLTSNNGWFSNIVNHVPTLGFNGNYGPQDFAASNIGGTLTFTVPAGTFKGPVEVGIDAGSWAANSVTVTCGGQTQDAAAVPGGGKVGTKVRRGIEANWFDLTGDFTSFTVSGSSGYCGYVYRVYVNGVELVDNAVEPRITFASDKGLSGVVPGEKLTQADGKAEGTVASINKADNSVTFSVSTGTWAVGQTAKGTTVTQNNVNQYCILNANGQVTGLQDADPGYVTQTASPTTLVFPSAFTPTGVPDTVLPAGTSLTAEVFATNAHGNSVKTSNTITPT